MAKLDPKKELLRKRSGILFFIFVCGLLLISWLIYFVATFNLNDYRDELSRQASDYCDLPVKLGEINFAFHGIALALHLKDVQVGSRQGAFDLDVPELWLSLKWTDLFQGRLSFLNMELDHPVLTRQFSTTDAAGTGAKFDLGLLREARIKGLRIRQGLIRIERIEPGQKQSFVLSDLNMKLSGLGTEQYTTLEMSGSFSGQPELASSPFQIEARLLQPSAIQLDSLPEFELDAEIDNLDAGMSFHLLSPGTHEDFLQGRADLRLKAKADASGQVNFNILLDANPLKVKPDLSYSTSFEVRRLMADGRWRKNGNQHSLSDLSFHLDKAQFSGSLDWGGIAPATDQLSISNGILPISQIKQWLPAFPERIRPFLAAMEGDQGRLLIDQAAFSRDREPDNPDIPWQIQSFDSRLQDVSWTLAEKHNLHFQEAQIRFSNRSWHISKGEGRFLSTPFSLKGDIAVEDRERVEIDFDVTSELSLPGALNPWLKATGEKLKLSGQIPLKTQIYGPMDELKIDLNADLGQLRATYQPFLQLVARQNDQLSINATLQDFLVYIDHAKLECDVFSSRWNGQIPLNNLDAAQLQGVLSIADLSDLSKVSPKLQDLQLEGHAELSIHQQGLSAGAKRQMRLAIREAAVHTGNAIADITRMNGEAELTGNGLLADNLSFYLGSSPVTVTVKMPDIHKPALVMDVAAPRIRADELVFLSDEAYLYDINGHLVIEPTMVKLDPVRVRLSQGTNPVIHGSISWGAETSVELNIAAEYAEIEEVIGLWSNKSQSAEKKSVKTRGSDIRPHQDPRVLIKAVVEKGRLYGMHFHEARGTIEPTKDNLIIHPLDFHVGGGFCNAQVLVDFRTENASTIRISGHAEDVDALEVYQELLNQKNIIRGDLRGDFYLQGQVGPEFLPTSYGQFNVTVKDGVLHKFPVLSKVFSLLNVSQLFSFELPDMDQEGMPFNRMTAHFSLSHGLLQSEDLVIRSEAMNLAYRGSFNLIAKELDTELAIQPLGTVDKVVSRLPVAGWLLTGEDKALFTAHFKIKGPIGKTVVSPAPITSLSDQTIGLLRRTLGLPFKLLEDPEILWGGEDREGSE